MKFFAILTNIIYIQLHVPLTLSSSGVMVAHLIPTL